MLKYDDIILKLFSIIQIILHVCYFPGEINTYHWARMSPSVDDKELFQRLHWSPKRSLAVRRYTFQRLYLNPLLPFLSHLPPPTAPTPLLLPSSLSSLIHSHCFFFLTLDSQDKLCLPHHILEEKGLIKVSITVQALVDGASSRHTSLTWAADSWINTLPWYETTLRHTHTHTASPSAFSILISLLLKDANDVNGNRTARLGSRSLFFRTEPGGLKIHRVPSRLVEDTNIPQFDWFCLVSQHKCGGGGFFPSSFKGKSVWKLSG